MGNCSKSNLQKQKQLVELISKLYKQNQQFLNLYTLAEDWATILRYGNWTDLKQLNIAHCTISDSKLEFIELMQFKKLQKLWIYGNQITAKGIQKISNNSLPQLESLHIQRNKLGNQGMEILVSGPFIKLKKLDVKSNNITHVGLRNFPNLRHSNITQLSLSQNLINYKGARLLAKTNLPSLQFLSLSKCMLGNEGAIGLSKGNWPNLINLDISYNQVGLNGYKQLAQNRFGELHGITIVESNNKIESISILTLVISKAEATRIKVVTQNRQLTQSLIKIFQYRFTKKPYK